MPPSPRPAGATPPRASIGVPTTSVVAFVSTGVLYLERMSVISEDGAGVLCDALPVEGEELPLCFRLSTHKGTLRARGRVMGHKPTTPAGLSLAQREGDAALHAVTGTMGDSATMMFRLSDLEKQQGAPKPSGHAAHKARATERAAGFCVRFVDLAPDVAAALARHLRISRRLGDQLSSAGGRVVELSEDDRPGLANLFDEGNLSKRAMDW